MLMLPLMPRCPASDICPRSGSTCAVGVRETKSWNRRPLIGRFEIAWLSRVTSDVSVVVSTTEVSAVTVTSSATPAGAVFE